MRLFFSLPDGLKQRLDRDGGLSYAGGWRSAGLANSSKSSGASGGRAAPPPQLTALRLAHRDARSAELRATYELRSPRGARVATHVLSLQVFGDGEILLHNEASLIASAPSLPRVGLRLGVPAALARCRWLGRGPYENYPDRCSAAAVARYEAGLDELFTPYLVPGECGHRGETRWLELLAATPPARGAAAPVLRVSDAGGPTFGFSLLRHTAAELDAAAHPHELRSENSGRLWLSLDHKMMGVGGDTGWTQARL